MKLKYYLRGMGIGIAVTSIVLSVASCNRRSMTDEEIIKRAEQLGMVTTEHTTESIFEHNSGSSAEPTSKDETDSTTESGDGTDTTDTTTTEPVTEPSTTEPVATEPATEPTTTEPATEPTTTEPATEPATTEPVTEPPTEPQSTDGENNIQYTLVIKSGMYSERVSQLLADNGIVDDANRFNTYLAGKGYDTRIRTGTYRLNSGMTYEQIARIICGI